MQLSKQVKELSKKTIPLDWLKLAIKKGNEQLYLDFHNRKLFFKEVSERLSLQKEFENYSRENTDFSKKSIDNQIENVNNYELFLLEKICFPNGINDPKIKEIVKDVCYRLEFFIFPKQAFQNLPSYTQIIKNEHEVFRHDSFWKIHPTTKDDFKEAAYIFPITASEKENMIRFGQSTSNRIEIIVEDNRVVVASFLIDVTSHYQLILKQIIQFCETQGFTILDKYLTLLPFDFKDINNIIETSEEFLSYQKSLNK